jgi:hypothetical protein
VSNGEIDAEKEVKSGARYTWVEATFGKYYRTTTANPVPTLTGVTLKQAVFSTQRKQAKVIKSYV